MYEVAVQKSGQRLFSTNPKTCESIHELRPLLDLLIAKFPESEGHSMVLIRHNPVDMVNISGLSAVEAIDKMMETKRK